MSKQEKNQYLFGRTFMALLKKNIYVDVPVYGLSMFPFYLPEDVVRVEAATLDNLIKGNVIVFTRHNKLVAHRLLKADFNQEIVWAKGDGLIKIDNILSISNVHGVVIHHYRKGRELSYINHKHIKQLIACLSPALGYVNFPLSRIWYKFFRKSKL